MKVDQGLTYAEIAEVLGCPLGTVKSRFHLGVRKLREELGASWGNPTAGGDRNVL